MKNIEKIHDALKDLTPTRKLEFLHAIIEKEKNKKIKQQLFLLIQKVKQDQLLIEESIRDLEIKKIQETIGKQKERLESLVQEEAIKVQQKAITQPLQLYGGEQKDPEKLYRGEEIKGPLYEPKQSEHQQSGRNMDRESTLQEEQNLINPHLQMLEKERKKYQSMK